MLALIAVNTPRSYSRACGQTSLDNSTRSLMPLRAMASRAARSCAGLR